MEQLAEPLELWSPRVRCVEVELLLEDWSDERIRTTSAMNVDIANGKLPGSFASEGDTKSAWLELVDVYWDHIAATCPAE